MARTLTRRQLSKETYKAVCEYVRENPGLNYVQISRGLDINYATCRHRVMEMVVNGEAAIENYGNKVAIFPTDTAHSES